MHRSLFIALPITVIIIFLSACGSEDPQPTSVPTGVVVTNITEENTVPNEIIQRRTFDQCDSTSSFNAQVKFSQSAGRDSQEELVLKGTLGGEVTFNFVPTTKLKLESAIEKHYASSESSSQGYQEGVDINVPSHTFQEYVIIWQETRREGTLEYIENGEVITASYSYRIGLELVTATGKDIPCTDRTPTPEPTNTPNPPTLTPTLTLTPTHTPTAVPTATLYPTSTLTPSSSPLPSSSNSTPTNSATSDASVSGGTFLILSNLWSTPFQTVWLIISAVWNNGWLTRIFCCIGPVLLLFGGLITSFFE